MKKLKLKTGAITMLLFLMLFAYSCCPCYLEQTFTNVSDVRSKTIALISNSGDSIKNHKLEIENTGKIIDNAISTNKGRKGNKEIGMNWSQLKNDSTGVYDRFISDWKKNIVLSTVYSGAVKKQINTILDQIIKSENAIKEKGKPCK